MAKADVDPAELQRFARELTRFSSELESLINRLHARMQGLQQSWRDQEQRKFEEEFNQTIKALSRFMESSNKHAAFLVKKAKHIEDYLQQH